jgi:hypothetical protein
MDDVNKRMSGSGVLIELSSEQVEAVLHASDENETPHEELDLAVLRRALSAAGRPNRDSAGAGGLVRSLSRCLCVLAAFSATGTARGIAEVAQELGMSRTTAHRYVSALVELELLGQDPVSRQYRILRE